MSDQKTTNLAWHSDMTLEETKAYNMQQNAREAADYKRKGYDMEDAVDYQQGDVLLSGLAGYPTHPFTRVLRRIDGGFTNLPLRNWLAARPAGYDDSWFVPKGED